MISLVMNTQSRCVYPPLPQGRNAVDTRTFQAGERICIRPNSLTAAIIGGPNPTFTYNNLSILPTDTHSPKWHSINVVKSDGTQFRSLVPFQDLGKYYPITNEISLRSVLRQKNIKVGKEGNQGRAINTAMAEIAFLPYLRPQGGKSRKARRGGRKTRRNRK